jgi:transposase
MLPPQPLSTRRSTLAQSRTLCIGMEVHKDTMAVAYVAQDHGAAVPSRGTLGPRQCDIEQLIRTMQSKATPLLLVSEAGPCGDWLYRYLRKQDYDCWGVAPSLMPKQAGDRVKTDRRAALQLARLARSGALTGVSVPQVHEEAMRALTRARADAIRALKDAQCRLKAFVLRHAIRDTGRAHGGPAHLRWLSAVGCPTPTHHMVFPEYVRAVQVPHASTGSSKHSTSTCKPGVCTRWARLCRPCAACHARWP